MGSERPAPKPPVDDAAERSARVRAMLTRWQTEDTSAEPDWEIDDVEAVHLEPSLDHASENEAAAGQLSHQR